MNRNDVIALLGSSPILAALAPVMEPAGWQCECRGECGGIHKAGRCDEVYSSRRGLLAVPADAELTIAAAAVRAAELVAKCPGCWESAHQRAEAGTVPADLAVQEPLFGDPERPAGERAA